VRIIQRVKDKGLRQNKDEKNLIKSEDENSIKDIPGYIVNGHDEQKFNIIPMRNSVYFLQVFEECVPLFLVMIDEKNFISQAEEEL
jgi:hypothetical protein